MYYSALLDVWSMDSYNGYLVGEEIRVRTASLSIVRVW